MDLLNISIDRQKELNRLMKKLGVNEQEIKESFIRSSGKGGQNVNKVSTCVVLQHLPSGIMVKCQESRTQSLNRYRARKLLLAKIQSKQSARIQEKIDLFEKNRRRKRGRSDTGKEKILVQKHFRSEKKATRQSIPPHRLDES